jgi:hypothetical protein
MESELGELLTRWTVRLAVACYVGRLVYALAFSERPQNDRWPRLLWTAGCAVYLVHVACAFQFFHGWSHSTAYEYTARRTADVVGLHWGGGLYINYAFTLLWFVDAALWWRDSAAHLERRGFFWTVQAAFAFMMFNATAIFGPPFWRWLALLAAFILIAAWRAGNVSDRSAFPAPDSKSTA